MPDMLTRHLTDALYLAEAEADPLQVYLISMALIHALETRDATDGRPLAPPGTQPKAMTTAPMARPQAMPAANQSRSL